MSGVITYHQIKDDEVLIKDFLDLVILGEDFLQRCGRKLTLSFITRVCREEHQDDQGDITYEQTHTQSSNRTDFSLEQTQSVT